MTIQNTKQSAPLAAQTEVEARSAGVFGNRLEIRSPHGHVGVRLTAWIHDRLGRQLGKFAPSIERIEVRFDDMNGTKGGVDRTCMVHVVLSALPPVVVEMQGASDHEAFDRAAGRAERATARNLEKHGFSTGHKKRHRGADSNGLKDAMVAQPTEDETSEAQEDNVPDESNPWSGSTREPHPHLKDSPGLTLRARTQTQGPEAKAFRNRIARTH